MLALALALGFSPGGCGEAQRAELSGPALDGRSSYLGLCIACHHADPTQDGALGPAIAGSSRALLQAKVLHGSYPPGYKPKRSSIAMPPFPHLADQIDALHAFLTESQGGSPSGDPAP